MKAAASAGKMSAKSYYKQPSFAREGLQPYVMITILMNEA